MIGDFRYESLSVADRRQIHNALAATTIKHINGGDGLFTAAPFDTAANPSQILENVHLDPAPTEIEEIVNLANHVGPHLFPAIADVMSFNRPFISAAKILLEQRNHIMPVTTHQQIADVALWNAAWLDALRLDDWPQRNGMIISRGVTTISAFGMAASEVVQKEGATFLSFPRSKTIAELGIDENLIDTNNRRMRTAVSGWLGRVTTQGKTLHSAWEGSTYKVDYGDDHRPERVEMGQVSKGVLSYLKKGLVLPVVVWDCDDPIVVVGELAQVRTVADIEKIHEWQRTTLAKKLGLSDDKVTRKNVRV